MHLYAHRIGAGGERQYELVTESADLVELAEPFDIKLPVSELAP
ncbi:hypothetical protein AB0H63_24250 [Micromonospora echinospora]